jgi:hypothetical protein
VDSQENRNEQCADRQGKETTFLPLFSVRPTVRLRKQNYVKSSHCPAAVAGGQLLGRPFLSFFARQPEIPNASAKRDETSEH